MEQKQNLEGWDKLLSETPHHWLLPATPATKKQRQALHILASYLDTIIKNATADEAMEIASIGFAVLDRVKLQEKWLWNEYYERQQEGEHNE